MHTFRSALKRILAFIGLAPIRQVHALSGTVARADTKVDALKRRLATVHGELRTRKHEMKQISRACDASERETREWQGSAERSKAKTAEWKVTAETWKQPPKSNAIWSKLPFRHWMTGCVWCWQTAPLSRPVHRKTDREIQKASR